MIEDFLKPDDFLINSDHMKEKLKNVVQNYNFNKIYEIAQLEENTKQKIFQKIKESKVVIIDQSKNLNIIVFEKTIIIHEYSQSTSLFLHNLLSNNPEILICSLSEANEIKEGIKDHKQQISLDASFTDENESLTKELKYIRLKQGSKKIWGLIVPSISAY